MQDLVTVAINIGGWAVVLAIIYDRINKLEDKIINCIIPKIEKIDNRLTVVEDRCITKYPQLR